MSNTMTFPDTWEEFEQSYGFADTEEVYTNGSRLIPSFRVKQWLDYENKRESKRQATVSSDCISRQAAIDAVSIECREFRGIFQDCENAIEALPSAQPELVRCKDCRWGREACGNIECRVDTNIPPEYHGHEWFCPNGERRTDE